MACLSGPVEDEAPRCDDGSFSIFSEGFISSEDFHGIDNHLGYGEPQA